MKTMRVLVVAVLVGVMSVVSRPVLSQDNPASVSSERYDDDGDDDPNYSWVGLLGLIGLAGLARKNRVTPTNTANPGQVRYGTP